MTAPSRIAGRPERAVGTPLDRGDAAEEQVPIGPAPYVEAVVRKRVGDLVGPASLDVDGVTVDMKARPRDRVGDR